MAKTYRLVEREEDGKRFYATEEIPEETKAEASAAPTVAHHPLAGTWGWALGATTAEERTKEAEAIRLRARCAKETMRAWSIPDPTAAELSQRKEASRLGEELWADVEGCRKVEGRELTLLEAYPRLRALYRALVRIRPGGER